MLEPSTSPSLLLAARDGSVDGWNRFVQLYGPLIYRWLRRAGMQSHDASDVTQEVLFSVSKNLNHYDPDRPRATFRGWLWTITRRRMADFLRNRQDQHLLGSAVEDLSVWIESGDPPTDARLDQSTLIRRAVAMYRDRFDPKTWQAFWATTVEGRDPAEVAETLAINRWSVYKARARILQRLRAELAGLLGDHEASEDDDADEASMSEDQHSE